MKLRLSKLGQQGFDHVTLGLAFVVIIAIGGSYYLMKTNANAWSGSLKLNDSSNLCMENMNNSNVANTTVRAILCSSSSQAQHWSRQDVPGKTDEFQLVAAASGACIDDPAGNVQAQTGTANRVYLETSACNSGDTTQVWKWGGTGNHQLINVRSGGCINYPATNNSVGRLVVYSCASNLGGSGTNAQWIEVGNSASGTTTSSSGGSSATVNTGGTNQSAGGTWSGALKVGVGNNLCMENMNNSNVAYTTVRVVTCNSSSQAQHFTKKYLSGSSSNFQLVAAASGACVDDTKGSVGTTAANRIYLQTWPCNASDHAQIWTWAGSGRNELKSAYNNGCINDAANGGPATRLVVYTCQDTANEHWAEVSNSASGAPVSSNNSATQPTTPSDSAGTASQSDITTLLQVLKTTNPSFNCTMLANTANVDQCNAVFGQS